MFSGRDFGRMAPAAVPLAEAGKGRPLMKDALV
jgi:hypothetical protein